MACFQSGYSKASLQGLLLVMEWPNDKEVPLLFNITVTFLYCLSTNDNDLPIIKAVNLDTTCTFMMEVVP